MSTKTEPERFLTIAQAAELTSYDEKTVLGWLHEGLPHVAGKGGRRRPRHEDIRIRSSALAEWMARLEIVRAPKGVAPKAKAPMPPKTKPAAEGLGAWRELKKAKAHAGG